MAEFRDRLEAGLSAKHMTPAELSKITGIGEGAISQYRKGAYKATQRNLEKIALALGVSIPWLMGITDEETPGTVALPSLDLTTQEEGVVLAYRAADPLDKALVRRVLNVDQAQSEEQENAG